jgi:tetratricopeptide (TPR) repeat protein
MKKLIVAILFVGVTTLSFGQYVPKGKTTKAESALNQGKLDIAKAEVDLAFEVDEKGKVTSSGKNWYLRGRIYKAIYLDDSTEYSDLAGEEALKIAMESFNKVNALENENSTYAIFTSQEVSQLYAVLVNEGAEKYNENDFEGAYEYFMKALVATPNDTTALLYGGVSAQQADMIDEAISCFSQLVDNGNANVDTYKTLIYLYRTEKEDMDKVLETVEKALEKFPNDKEFTQEKITTLIVTEKVEEAKTELESAISQDPTNALYYYFLGYLYDFQEEFDRAQENYEKAIELNPDYYDANYNLAVIHYNKAREVIHELNELSLDEYRKQEAAYAEKAQVYFRDALPYFEKAAEVAADDDLQLLETLQGIYLKLNMKDQASALDAKIKVLSGQ